MEVKMDNYKESDDTFYLTSEVAKRKRRKKKMRKNILLCACIALFVAFLLGIVLSWRLLKPDHQTYSVKGTVGYQITCSGIPDKKKYDCYPDAPVSESECINRGCCFVPSVNITSGGLPPLNVPYCYYPSNYVGYIVKEVLQTPRKIQAKLKRYHPSGFPKDVSDLNLLVTFIDDSTVRVKITDANTQRYEVPLKLYYETKELSSPLYNVAINSTSGFLTITRKVTDAVIFNADLNKLVYSDQFLQLSSDLPSSFIYGIGEHYGGILRSVNWTRFTLINSDLAPIPNHGLYGSHPFYMVLEKGGNANGVFLFNSNIMDVILQPAPAITFRPIGGILDFFIMLGPSPKEVAQQFSNIVGKPFMPPFWSLGFHLCRYGYKSLNKTRETMQRTINAGIPLDVQWNDIDYMDEYKDFTYDKKNFAGLPEFVDELHAKGMHYVIITDPGLSSSEKVYYAPYEEGLNDDVFVKNANGSVFVGKVWTAGTTVYPDFTHPAATPFWTRQVKRLHDDVKFDGIWIDMNEPSNFLNGGIDGCPKLPEENPQYVPGGNPLVTKTVCMSAKHYYTTHYNNHNIYAYFETISTNEALRNVRKKRPFIISRATFPGQGVYGGHWSGDIFSTWEDMRYTIPSLINFNMYAIPMIGSDICGFNGNTTVELCARWQTLGAFYPFSRNHNERVTIEQDPVALGQVVVQAARISLLKRYTLLPYLYTLFYRSHAFGESVIRPLFFEFPEDINTYGINEQFLWGSSLMIVPILYPNTTTVDAYFPKGLWYSSLDASQRKSSGEKFSLTIPLTDIHLSVRSGIIITSISPELTTTAMRKNPFTLSVALNEKQEAYGELYWDDGDSLETYENGFYNLIQFDVTGNTFSNKVVNRGYQTDMNLQTINIAGLSKFPSQVILNDDECVSMPNVASSSTANNVDNGIEMNLGFFGINVVQSNNSSANANCTFFKLGEMLVIQPTSKPVSLLSPLIAMWK